MDNLKLNQLVRDVIGLLNTEIADRLGYNVHRVPIEGDKHIPHERKQVDLFPFVRNYLLH